MGGNIVRCCETNFAGRLQVAPERFTLDGCAMARPARDLWSPNYLLQSLRSVAAGWRLGPDHGCLPAGHDARCRWLIHPSSACTSTAPVSRTTIAKTWGAREGG